MSLLKPEELKEIMSAISHLKSEVLKEKTNEGVRKPHILRKPHIILTEELKKETEDIVRNRSGVKRGRSAMEASEYVVKDLAPNVRMPFSIVSEEEIMSEGDILHNRNGVKLPLKPLPQDKVCEAVTCGGIYRRMCNESSFKLFGLHPLCVLAIDSFNKNHNTKYEFLKIEIAESRMLGIGYSFYIIFQAQDIQNVPAQTFHSEVFRNYVTKEIKLFSCRLKVDKIIRWSSHYDF